MKISGSGRLRTVALAMAAAGALTATAGVCTAETGQPSQNPARVYFYRTGGLPIWNAYFFVDGERLANLPYGQCTYTSVLLPPGNHSLKHGWPLIQMATTFQRKLKLSVKWDPNGVYYYNLNHTIKGGAVNTEFITELSQVDPVAAAQEIAGCKYLAPVKGEAAQDATPPAIAGTGPPPGR
jgi:hypothetical protein